MKNRHLQDRIISGLAAGGFWPKYAKGLGQTRQLNAAFNKDDVILHTAAHP